MRGKIKLRWQWNPVYVLEQNIHLYIPVYYTNVDFQDSNLQKACKFYEINQYSLLQKLHT